MGARALPYYEQIAEMDHGLPGMFLYTGRLHETLGNTEKARGYYLLEIQHNRKVLKTATTCSKHQLRSDLKEAKMLLEELTKNTDSGRLDQ